MSHPPGLGASAACAPSLSLHIPKPFPPVRAPFPVPQGLTVQTTKRCGSWSPLLSLRTPRNTSQPCSCLPTPLPLSLYEATSRPPPSHPGVRPRWLPTSSLSLSGSSTEGTRSSFRRSCRSRGPGAGARTLPARPPGGGGRARTQGWPLSGEAMKDGERGYPGPQLPTGAPLAEPPQEALLAGEPGK